MDKLTMLEQVQCSSLAGLISRFLTHPLDTLKTVQQYGSRPSTSGLYRGLSASLLFSVPATTLYLTSYEKTKELFPDNQHDFATHVFAAAVAELSSSAFWVPMEVLKSKMQVLEPRTGILGLARNIYQTRGIAGFFHGYMLSQAVFIPYTIIYFVSYERLKSAWTHRYRHHNFGSFLACSFTAATLAGGITNVVDVVKTRVQVDGASVNQAFKEIYNRYGIRGFANGLVSRVMWAAPSMAIRLTIYEYFKEMKLMSHPRAVL